MASKIENLSADTITDEQIEALRIEARAARDWTLDEACERALTLAGHFGEADRAICADAINAATAMED